MRSIKDLAAATGHSASNISWAINVGLLPPPDLCPLKRRYYSAEQFQRAVRSFSRTHGEEYFVCSELCRQLQISTHRFGVWRRRGLVPEPLATRGKREAWSGDQVQEIRKLLPGLLKLKPHRSSPPGYYNQTTAALELAMPKITFFYWVENGVVPRPTKVIPGYPWPFYSESDLEKIRKQQAAYFERRSQVRA